MMGLNDPPPGLNVPRMGDDGGKAMSFKIRWLGCALMELVDRKDMVVQGG